MNIDRKDFLRRLGLLGAAGLGGWPLRPPHPADEILKPPRLRRGDTIGLVSPASTLPELSRYDRVVRKIRSLGYGVREGAHARDRHGNLAGADRDRAADLMAMFRDPGVDAVMAFRGGWGSNRILEMIDFQLIRDHPKALIGFSDITSLLLSVYARSGLITFHGPVGKSEWSPFTLGSFRNALGNAAPYTLRNEQGDGGRFLLREGTAEGILLGGNLSVLSSMVGSGYLPDFSGGLLFLEEVGEHFYRIDRMLTQLRLSGILEKLSGFIFGVCADCSRGTPRAHGLEEVLRNHIEPLGIPAFAGMRFGHLEDTLTLPVGVRARMDARSGSLRLLEAPVR